jgi:hypothetical protein
MKKHIKYKVALFDAVSEDFRKIGLYFVGAGQLGLLIDNSKISAYSGLMIISLGLLFWFNGLYLAHNNDKINKDGKK